MWRSARRSIEPWRTLADADTERTTVDHIVEFLQTEAKQTTFLFHFDEIGVFEAPDPDLGITMIHRVWAIADQLRVRLAHFYLLSGRSVFLSSIGKGELFPYNGNIAPTKGVLIPLPLLREKATIVSMFADWPS